ncbi:MAG: PEP-CTERM sorting domain-containing protein [Gemmatimonadota bacterium]
MRLSPLLGAVTLLFATAVPLVSQTTSPVVPETDFGPRPFLTFGGTGIPTDAVESNSLNNQIALGGVHLFLSATPRYDNPTLGNDGAGTFYAMAGTDDNPPSPANPYALWNFDWAIVGDNTDSYTYRLYYDFNPATGNFGDYGYVAVTPSQDSWNLGMDFLAAAFAGVVAPPSFPSFDPNAAGEYGFALAAFTGETEVGRSAILVNTQAADVVPEPATMSLLALGLAGMAAAQRRKRSGKGSPRN